VSPRTLLLSAAALLWPGPALRAAEPAPRAQETAAPDARIPGPVTAPFLRWSEADARRVVQGARQTGTAGSRLWDGRVKDTHRSSRYKVRAILWTPRALRAAARLVQLRERLSNAETLALLAAVESRPLHVASIEIDPIEGSGVLPHDETRFFLQRPGDESASVRAVEATDITGLPLFHKFEKRDWAYELLVTAFPRALESGEPLAAAGAAALELVVEIGGKGEHLSFPLDGATGGD
jgi:hypothetical protein